MNRQVFEKLFLVERYAPKVPPAAALALITIESNGDPYARRPGSRYWGLLQMSQAYLDDARKKNVLNVSALDGDAQLAIEVFADMQHKYRHLIANDPDRIALAHKAGVGALKRYVDHYASKDVSVDDAWPEIYQYYKDRGVDLPRVPEYLRRFRKSYAEWKNFLDNQRPDEDGIELACWIPEDETLS